MSSLFPKRKASSFNLVLAFGAVLHHGLSVAAASKFKWTELAPQHSNQDQSRPSVRYSHTATVVNQTLIISHGYYYNHGEKDKGIPSTGATWLDDTWAYDIEAGNNGAVNAWKRLDKRKETNKPHARMSHTATNVKGRYLFFGGDDGGHRDSNVKGYVGSFLSDLWELDVKTGIWTEVEFAENAVKPDQGYAHHGVISSGSMMHIVNGLRQECIWSFNVDTNTWKEVEQKGITPGKRHGMAVAGDLHGDGFYMFGGFAFKDDVTDLVHLKSGPLEDLWFFSFESNTWTLIQETHPAGPRTYGSAEFINSPLGNAHQLADPAMLVFGGANCQGSCICHGDTWMFSYHSREWSKFDVGEEPITRYKQATVVYNNGLYSYGGESYKPYMYHNSMMRLQWGPLLPAEGNRGATQMESKANDSLSPLQGFEIGLLLVVIAVMVGFAYLMKSRSVERKMN